MLCHKNLLQETYFFTLTFILRIQLRVLTRSPADEFQPNSCPGGSPLLLLELPGANKDLGVQNVEIDMLDGYDCPEGTQ